MFILLRALAIDCCVLLLLLCVFFFWLFSATMETVYENGFVDGVVLGNSGIGGNNSGDGGDGGYAQESQECYGCFLLLD